MFKNLTNFASAMKNLTQLGPQVRALHAKLETARIYGSSTTDRGSVNIEMNGLGVVTQVSVDPGLLNPESKLELETRLVDAINQANRTAKEMHIQAIREVTGGVEVFPGFNDVLKNFVG
jgi:hypothetical protein